MYCLSLFLCLPMVLPRNPFDVMRGKTIVSISRTYQKKLNIFVTVELDQLYRRARKRHGNLNRDVVHDLYVKFGTDLPCDAYITTCIKHARPQPAQQVFDLNHLEGLEDHQEQSIEITRTLNRAIENVRKRYDLEVDTFLECCVNSNFKAFSAYSSISVSVLRKICKFTQNQIKDEFNRIS